MSPDFVYVNFTAAASIVTAVGAILIWLHFRSQNAVLNERIRAKDEALRVAAEEITGLRADNTKLSRDNAQMSTQLSAEREAYARQTHEFTAISAEALRTNRSDFLAQAQQVFAQLQQQSIGDLDQRKEAVAALVQPIRESLDKVDAKIYELEKARAGAYGALGEQLKSLQLAHVQLQSETARLANTLTSTSYAGSWGEIQLRRVVEMADMLPYCDFSEQESSGSLRADLIVRLPGGQRIVVDAKAPLESFRAAHSATTPETRTTKLAEHAQRVRAHVDALGAKNYWEQFQPAPEFVVMFLPGDHVLSSALQNDNLLLDRALRRRVLLASPTTLIALLKAAAYGWQHEAISRNAEEISALGRSLYDRVAVFADNLEKIGRGLDAATKGYNSAVGSFEGMLLPGARKLAELGARGVKELNSPERAETALREVSRRN